MSATPANPHRLGLTVGRDVVLVQLGGDIDLESGPDLTRLMNGLDLLAYLAVDIDMANVTFLDSYGIQPLVVATRRRQRDQLAPVLIGNCSPAVRFYLDVSGLQGRPQLDLPAWDRTVRNPRNKPGVVPLAQDDTEAAAVAQFPGSGTGTAVPSAVTQGRKSASSVRPRLTGQQSARQHFQQRSA